MIGMNEHPEEWAHREYNEKCERVERLRAALQEVIEHDDDMNSCYVRRVAHTVLAAINAEMEEA